MSAPGTPLCPVLPPQHQPLLRPPPLRGGGRCVWAGLTPLAEAVLRGSGGCLPAAAAQGWACRSRRVPWGPRGRSVSCEVQPGTQRCERLSCLLWAWPRHLLSAEAGAHPARPAALMLQAPVQGVSYCPAGGLRVNPKVGGQEGCVARCELRQGRGGVILSQGSEDLPPVLQPTQPLRPATPRPVHTPVPVL